MKLTRQQIKDGLEQIPIEEILLTSKQHGQALTHKQKLFAEEIAKGSTKAGAYKKAYNSKGSSHTRSREGSKLISNPQISAHVEQIKLAIEAQKYLFPAHLRALAIQQLTEKALDPAIPPAIQVKCLELIGKMSEVSLFTERKEISQTATTSEAKQRLIDSLAQAIRSSRSISDDRKKDAESLLKEITGSDPITIDQIPEIEEGQDINQVEADQLSDHLSADPDPEEIQNEAIPPSATPQNPSDFQPTTCHSIPHNQSPDFDVPRETLEMAPLSFTESEWGGVSNFENKDPTSSMENTPLVNSGSHVDGDNI